MAYTILVADDEAEIRNLLRLYLENEHYNVVEASDGNQALDVVSREPVSLCILDIMMPGMDGFHVLQRIRKTSNMPVLILSAKDRDSDKILGLNLGADDYLSKPFNPLEAVARVNSAIRRFYSLGADESLSAAASRGGTGAPGQDSGADSATGSGEGTASGLSANTVSVRDLILDEDSCVLHRGDETIELTSVEYKIMKLFMEHPGKVFTKQQLYEYGWGEEYFIADNNIMVCISKLRSKLDPADTMKYIRTIRGLGYRFEK